MNEIVILHYEQVLEKNWLLLKKAAKKHNIHLTTWEPHKIYMFCEGSNYYPLYDGQKINPEVILHRTVFRFGGVILPALNHWHNTGSLVINPPDAAFHSRDKLLTTLALCDAGVPIVPTTGFVRADKKTFSQLGNKKIIVKPAYGVRGEDIKLYPSAKDATQELADADFERTFLPLDYYVAQPFIDTGGVDIRAFVVDGKCVALMERQAKEGEFRANLANDAIGTPLPLTHPASKIAVAAINACKLDYGGVDMIEDKNGIKVLETDAWGGFAGITKITGVDVAGAILDMVVNKLKEKMK